MLNLQREQENVSIVPVVGKNTEKNFFATQNQINFVKWIS